MTLPSDMTAVVADSLDALANYQLRQVKIPAPGPDQVLIRVAACGVGYVDALVALGRYQVKPPTPYVPGREVSGIIEAVGSNVLNVSPGDRVFAMAQGGFSEFVRVPAAAVHQLSESMSFLEAACFPLNYLTACHGLRDRGMVQAGETVLVFGAAGGVGSAAIQIAKALGAIVIAAASKEEKRSAALRFGADLTIDTNEAGWRERLKETLGGKKPDVIFDPVCGPLFEPAFRSLNWRGRHLVIGFAGGPIPALPSNLTLMKGASLIGVDVRQYMEFEGRNLAEDFRQLTEWYREGFLRPAVGPIYAFSDYTKALTQALSGRSIGKVVLQIVAEPDG